MLEVVVRRAPHLSHTGCDDNGRADTAVEAEKAERGPLRIPADYDWPARDEARPVGGALAFSERAPRRMAVPRWA